MELFSAATGLSKTRALTNIFELNSERIESFRLLKKYISQRCMGMPLPYITGIEGFWKRDFRVTTDTLIPRPETELLVEIILLAVVFPEATEPVMPILIIILILIN